MADPYSFNTVTGGEITNSDLQPTVQQNLASGGKPKLHVHVQYY